MKIWVGYGSEHSMNLVMIGRFEEASDAAAAKAQIDRLMSFAADEQAAGRLDVGEPARRFSDEMLDFVRQNQLWGVGPAELEQFLYDVSVKLHGNIVELATDESDVSAFLKVLLDHKARVEVFSAHHHARTKDGADH